MPSLLTSIEAQEELNFEVENTVITEQRETTTRSISLQVRDKMFESTLVLHRPFVQSVRFVIVLVEADDVMAFGTTATPPIQEIAQTVG